METVNAIIEKATITNDDHGILTAWLMLNYGNTAQGFGGYSLYLPKSFDHHNKGADYAGHFIWRVMEIAEVAEWSQLPGKTIRVKNEGLFGSIIEIGHIIKDDWFNPKTEFKQLTESFRIEMDTTEEHEPL